MFTALAPGRLTINVELKTLQQLAPALQLRLLLAENLYLPWEYAVEFSATAIHPRWEILRIPGMVEYAHAAGIAVHPWTVNSEADLAWVIGAGGRCGHHQLSRSCSPRPRLTLRS